MASGMQIRKEEGNKMFYVTSLNLRAVLVTKVAKKKIS